MSNREIANAFRAAKLRLVHPDRPAEYGQSRFICLALERCWGVDIDILGAKQVITGRMGSDGSLERWVRKKVPNIGHANQISMSAAEYQAYWNAMQDYRHRWLDALIEEFDPSTK